MSLEDILDQTGKNLCPVATIDTAKDKAGTITLNIQTHGTYTLSAKVTLGESDTANTPRMTLQALYTDDTFTSKTVYETADGEEKDLSVTLTTDSTKEIKNFVAYMFDYSTQVPETRNGSARNIQLETGSVATEYEPYYKGPDVVRIKLPGNNMIPYPYSTTSNTTDGVTYTVREDGGIAISGTATANSHFYVCDLIKLEVGKTYTLASHSGYALSIQDKSHTQIVTSINTSATFTAEYIEYYIYINVTSGQTVDVIVYPQLEVGSEATDYSRYSIKDVKKLVYSTKNLLSPSNASTQTITGVTFTNNSDGTITVSGTANANSTYNLGTISFPENKTVTLSGCPQGGGVNTFTLYAFDTKTNQAYHDFGEGTSFSFSDSINLYIRVYNTVTVSDVLFTPQLELGATATAYVPHKTRIRYQSTN